MEAELKEIYVVLRLKLPTAIVVSIIKQLRIILWVEIVGEFVDALSRVRNSVTSRASWTAPTTHYYHATADLWGAHFVERRVMKWGDSNEKLLLEHLKNKQVTAQQQERHEAAPQKPRKATPEDLGQVATKKARRDRRYKK